MELFCAGDESQFNVIKRWIDQSDIYVLLLGGRYGTLETTTGRSYTELEYDHAISRGKPHFALVLTERAIEEKVRTLDMPIDLPRKLRAFRAKVTQKIVRFVEDAKDIRIHMPHAIADLTSRAPLVGWARADGLLPDDAPLRKQLQQLEHRNTALRAQLRKTLQTVCEIPVRYLFPRERETITLRARYEIRGRRREQWTQADVTLGEVFSTIAPGLLQSRHNDIDPFRLASLPLRHVRSVEPGSAFVPDQDLKLAAHRLRECGLLEEFISKGVRDEQGLPARHWILTAAGRGLARQQRKLRALERLRAASHAVARN